MRAVAGTVIGGKIEFETDLPDGTPVAVLVAGGGGFQLTAEEEDELFASLEDIQSGNYIDADELLQELRTLYGR